VTISVFRAVIDLLYSATTTNVSSHSRHLLPFRESLKCLSPQNLTRMAFSQVAGETRKFTRKHFPILAKLVARSQSFMASNDSQKRKNRNTSNHPHGYSDHNTVSPIHLLPPEILIPIFHLVCDIRTYHFCPAAINPTASIGLAVRSSRTGDIIPHQCCDPMLSARLKAYATRSSQALLDVHFVLHPTKSPTNPDTLPDPLIENGGDGTIFPFLAAAAPRIRSLAVMTSSGPPFTDTFCRSVLAACFAHCTPGTLTEVSIEPPGMMSFDLHLHAFPHYQDGRLSVSAIEALWLPITVLKLSKCYVPWNSKAYHGLTELRLPGGPSLNSSTLVSILQSSPQLRILELDSFRSLSPDDLLLQPIRLDNLEVLVLVGVQDNWLGLLLRLIAPGLKPLSLSLSNPCEYFTGFVSKVELQRFIARSNITRFCINKVENLSHLEEILSILPTTRTLAIDSFSCEDSTEDYVLPPSFTLDTIYIIRSRGLSSLAWASFERLVKRHRVQNVILWRCDFRDRKPGKPGKERVPKKIYKICPTVEVMPDDEPNPIDEWYFRGLHNYFS
ncbi:hypothetical protein B0J17DRAFT_742399, partial [Rhizoctonia solani]